MKDFIEYIETSCGNIKDTQMSYLYKKEILNSITDRANEITHAGLKDEKVLADLIADEYPNLEENFPAWEKAAKKKKFAKTMRIILGVGGLLFFIGFFAAYFIISDATKAWDKTWLIIVGGVALALIADIIFAFATKQKFRTVTAMIYMPVISTMAYIILSAYDIITWSKGWPVILLGLVIDLIYILCIAASNAKYFMYKQEDDE